MPDEHPIAAANNAGAASGSAVSPKVSVITPMYNVERYVGECVASLIAQTEVDFEAILVDDGSTDGTVEAARKAAAGDGRFVFLEQDHGGQSAARNLGIAHARGKYVLFLDADDCLEADALSSLAKRAEEDSLDVVFFSASTFYDDAASRHAYHDEYDNRTDVDGVFSGHEMLVRFYETDAYRQSAAMQLLRRGFLDECGIRFYEGIIHEDNLFTLSVLANAGRCAFLNKPLYRRRIRMNSTMTVRRGIANVAGLFTSGYEMEQWLRGHLAQCEPDFERALSHYISYCYNDAAFTAIDVPDEQLEQYAVALDGQRRISFRIQIIEHSIELGCVHRQYRESATYKVGRAFTALPGKIKNRIDEGRR